MEVEDTEQGMVLDADISTDKTANSGCVLDSTDINKVLDDTRRGQLETSTSTPVGDIRNVSAKNIDDTNAPVSIIHGDVVQVEPMESTESQTTDEKDNDLEVTVIPQEIIDDVDTCDVEEIASSTHTVTDGSNGLEIHSTSKATVENNTNSSVEENILPKGTDRLDSERPVSEDDVVIVDQTTEKGSEKSLEHVDQITEVIIIEESVGLSKDKDVEERNEIALRDSDVVIVGDPSNLMEYRSTERVITINDSEDTSGDSSGSEVELPDTDHARTENTDAQINM